MARRSKVVRLGPRPRDTSRPRRSRSKGGRRSSLAAVLVVAFLAGLVAWNRGLSLKDLAGDLRARLDGAGESAGGSAGAAPDGPRGGVTHVRDGDTIELAGVAVRIANLDCAERDTAEGQAASARMRELVAGQEVACQLEGRRSYDREVGTCALATSGEDLGEVLIAEGTCGRWRPDQR